MTNHEDLALGQIPDDAIAEFEVEQDSGVSDSPQRPRPQRVDALTWRPRENAAFLTRKITFTHPILIRSWNPLLARAQITMFMLQEVTATAASIEEARQVEAIINDMLGKLESSLEAEITRLKHVYSTEGFDSIPEKNYTTSSTADIPVFSPGAGRFLSIMAKVDDLFWLAELLRLQGLIKLEHKFQILNQWKSLLWGNSRTWNSMWVSTKKIIAEKQARAAQKKPARSKADRATSAAAEESSAEAA